MVLDPDPNPNPNFKILLVAHLFWLVVAHPFWLVVANQRVSSGAPFGAPLVYGLPVAHQMVHHY
jgi:uncharacterized GH25 family protein